MKYLAIIFSMLLVFVFSFSNTYADTWVNGYTRSNGTYVQGHYRSSPNGTVNDNWSTKGNTNPYTGKAGTKRPNYSFGGSSSYFEPNRQSIPTYNRRGKSTVGGY